MLISSDLSLSLLALVSACTAIPLSKRRVPQEHSHEQFLTTVRTNLNLNNPDQIQDPVFGLLGNAAASAGQGKITDTDCLQTATADQAFTNAKAAGDVDGQVAALIYRALERNTGTVGLASVACTSFTPVNPEIAAISQHQDSSAGAATQASNKAITLALAKQIASIGGDPQLALKSGTFAPGDLNDSTGKGGSCDDANDPVGCIFTQNLLVEDATADEINAAVSGSGNASSPATSQVAVASPTQGSNSSTATCAPAVTVTVTAGSAPTATAPASGSSTAAAAAPSSTSSSSNSSTAGQFGKCTNPSVEFGAGLDGRKATEFSFINVDQQEFSHGSALNPAIIFQFTCDNLVNKCGLTNADAIVQTCRQANTDASALGKVGAAADLFNKALGFNTDFASVNTNVTASA